MTMTMPVPSEQVGRRSAHLDDSRYSADLPHSAGVDHPERIQSRNAQLAMLNVLEDFHQDRMVAVQTHGAILNILDDFELDKRFMSDTNRAVINILEDLEDAKNRTDVLNAQLEQRVMERTADLAHSEERFRLLVEGATDYAILMLDPDGKVVTWNAGAERIKGYQASEIIGRNFEVFYTAEDRASGKPRHELEKAIAIGQVIDEGWRVRKDGSKFLADVVITALRDDKGRLRGFGKLTRDITERKAAEAKARESLRQEMLLKEIHHRIKNNLQVISSLLFLQSTYVKDQNTLEILTESQSRVKSIALIHEKLYRSQDLEKLAFSDYVQDLLAEMLRTYRIAQDGIVVHTDVQQIYLGIDTAVPCGLIINELVSNVLKHAFPDTRKGDAWVRLLPLGGGQYTLTVSDNGVGMPKDFDLRRSKSLGLKLVADLTKQLDGKIEVDSTQGTSYRITFGELHYKERE